MHSRAANVSALLGCVATAFLPDSRMRSTTHPHTHIVTRTLQSGHPGWAVVGAALHSGPLGKAAAGYSHVSTAGGE